MPLRLWLPHAFLCGLLLSEQIAWGAKRLGEELKESSPSKRAEQTSPPLECTPSHTLVALFDDALSEIFSFLPKGQLWGGKAALPLLNSFFPFQRPAYIRAIGDKSWSIDCKEFAPLSLRGPFLEALSHPSSAFSRFLSYVKQLELVGFDLLEAEQRSLFLKACPNLLKLKFRNTRVSNADMASLSCLTRLLSLNLSRTGVGDKGLRHLPQSLRFLKLHGCTRVTNRGLRPLLPRLLTLESLDLRGTQVSSAALEKLPASLLFLCFEGLSEAAWEKIRAQYPKIRLVENLPPLKF